MGQAGTWGRGTEIDINVILAHIKKYDFGLELD